MLFLYSPTALEGWTEQARFAIPGAGKQLGSERIVSIEGDTLVVGTPRATAALQSSAGGARVFVRTGGTWASGPTLESATPAPWDELGHSVAVNGDTIALGGRNNIACVFRRVGVQWQEEARLAPSDTVADVAYGWGIALSGDVLVVGAPGWRTPLGVQTGAAYVYRRTGATWIQEQILVPSDGEEPDGFGRSVSVDGERIAVGSINHDYGTLDDAGAVYVFTRFGGAWIESPLVQPLVPMSRAEFGTSVVLRGDLLAVGAHRNSYSAGGGHGAVYVFKARQGTWSEELVHPGSQSGARVGWCVDLEGERLIVGAPFGDGREVAGGAAFLRDIAGY